MLKYLELELNYGKRFHRKKSDTRGTGPLKKPKMCLRENADAIQTLP